MEFRIPGPFRQYGAKAGQLVGLLPSGAPLFIVGNRRVQEHPHSKRLERRLYVDHYAASLIRFPASAPPLFAKNVLLRAREGVF